MCRENKVDIILSFAAFFQIAVLMFQELLVSANFVTHEASRSTCISIAALPMIIAMYYVIKRRFLLFLLTYSLFEFIIISTIIFYPSNEKYLSIGKFNILFVNLPCFLCLAAIYNIEILKRIMLYLSYVIFTLGIIYLSFLLNGTIRFSSYSLTFSYYLLLPSLIFVSQKKIIFTFIFLIVCIMMLMLGSRGALITALIYALSVLILDKKIRKNIILTAIVILIGIVSGEIISLLFKLSSNLNISSRTLELLLGGDIAQDTGRLGIFSIVWNNILKNPFLGSGIFGDRVLLGGIYCHNFFLEVFCNFGIILGSGLILLLSIAIVRTFLSSDPNNKKLLLMFFCYTFIPLMVSLSYLTFPQFGIFVGFLYALSEFNSHDIFYAKSF